MGPKKQVTTGSSLEQWVDTEEYDTLGFSVLETNAQRWKGYLKN